MRWLAPTEFAGARAEYEAGLAMRPAELERTLRADWHPSPRSCRAPRKRRTVARRNSWPRRGRRWPPPSLRRVTRLGLSAGRGCRGSPSLVSGVSPRRGSSSHRELVFQGSSSLSAMSPSATDHERARQGRERLVEQHLFERLDRAAVTDGRRARTHSALSLPRFRSSSARIVCRSWRRPCRPACQRDRGRGAAARAAAGKLRTVARMGRTSSARSSTRGRSRG